MSVEKLVVLGLKRQVNDMDYQKLTENNERLEQAWVQFMEGGVIDKTIVRPDIARSWHRCLKQKGDHDIEPLPLQVVEKKQRANQDFIQASRPVMQDMALMLKNSLRRFSVLLLDREGDIIDRINEGTDLLCLGHHCNEIHSGTTAGGLALIDGVGVEVSGYEHLYPYAHRWHTIGVPVHDCDNGIVGVFGLLNTDGPCPPLTMQMVSLGAQLIETRLRRDQVFLNFSTALLEKMGEAALLVNREGFVIDANQECLDFFEISPKHLINQYLVNYLSGNREWQTFASTPNRADGFFSLVIKNHQTRGSHVEYPCQVSKFMVKPDGMTSLTLFTFKPLREISPYLPTELPPPASSVFENLIGHDPSFVRVLESARRASVLASNVLIEGESGTGKEVLARSIHEASGRRGPFIALNCGSLPRELLISELFGYEEGAFTGARKGGNPGKFELADHGTLFLDEIGEMPLDMQVTLLRFLEDKTVVRVGGNQPRTVDVRIIAATNRSLFEEVQKGRFREDLFYRLHVVYLHMPPLRERRGDIPLLAEHLLTRICERNRLGRPRISSSALSILNQYDWPGNVRELQNVLESSLILSNGDSITPDCLPEYLQHAGAGAAEKPQPLPPSPRSGGLRDQEQAIILDTLARCNGNISKAARTLGISRTTLYTKLEQMGIKRS